MSATPTCSGDFVVFGASKIWETACFLILQFYLITIMEIRGLQVHTGYVGKL
jgi:hypothetical protein